MKNLGAIVFSGVFDPIHEGHVSVVRELYEEVEGEKGKVVVIATALTSPRKKNYKPTSFGYRLKMWELTLDFERIPWSHYPVEGRVLISDFKYTHPEEFIKWWETTYGGGVTWGVSSYSSLKEPSLEKFSDMHVPLRIVNSGIDVHSSEVREGKYPLFLPIREYAAHRELYPSANWENKAH